MPYNNTPIEPSKEITGHVSLPLARVQKIINADPERINTSKNASFAIALATEMFIQHLATTTHNVVKAERKPRRNIQYRDVSSAVAKTDNLEFLVDVVPKTVTYGQYKKRMEATKSGKGLGRGRGWGRRKKGRQRGRGGGGGGGRGSGLNLEEEVKKVLNGDTETSGTPMFKGYGAAAAKAPEAEEKHEDDAMDVDDEPMQRQTTEAEERVEESELEEDDAAAMQIEMEMRGPPRPAPGPRASVSASPQEVRRSSGFTAINGSR
ncbi:hypothetical protein N0V83_006802 [Neocucurbitaria cava]|uniref:Transcription factor CBF/NF-Y/archaeal histone domain-containing protein n=1 Tax=Neocucurbitaria cava TaxID=798079 RepID=A0A9W9CKL6_9PLEO|nr:hypothetical protein N0V83_006802 [Neocucurbitaria cava]